MFGQLLLCHSLVLPVLHAASVSNTKKLFSTLANPFLNSRIFYPLVLHATAKPCINLSDKTSKKQSKRQQTVILLTRILKGVTHAKKHELLHRNGKWRYYQYLWE
jgi:hypothetical protein